LLLLLLLLLLLFLLLLLALLLLAIDLLLLRLRIVLVTDLFCRRSLIALFRLRGLDVYSAGFGPRCATTGPPPLVAGSGPDFARKITRCTVSGWSCERG